MSMLELHQAHQIAFDREPDERGNVPVLVRLERGHVTALLINLN